MIAALYIDPKGPYPKIAGVDCWDEARNAKLYPGPGPVIAHPPCGPWGKLRHFVKEVDRKQDPECARIAIGQVRKFAGILEHPATSLLWAEAGMPRPDSFPDEFGGWTLLLEQCRFGHPCRKLTWLYIVGCAFEDLPPIPGPGTPTHWCGGGRRHRSDKPGRQVIVPAHLKVASAQQRRRTPQALAEWLVAVAERCRK